MTLLAISPFPVAFSLTLIVIVIILLMGTFKKTQYITEEEIGENFTVTGFKNGIAKLSPTQYAGARPDFNPPTYITGLEFGKTYRVVRGENKLSFEIAD